MQYNRETEKWLLDFFTAQHQNPQPEAWKSAPEQYIEILALTTAWLSGVEWYGHKKQLRDIAIDLVPDIFQDEKFLALISQFRMPFYRFSPSLKQRVLPAEKLGRI